MFGIESSEMLSNVLYRDAAGTTKHAGDEPFRYPHSIPFLHVTFFFFLACFIYTVCSWIALLIA
jgi:hypothetical protein